MMVEAFRQNSGKENRLKDGLKANPNEELAVMEARYEKLKNQYVELMDMRETEAERIFHEYRKAAEAKELAQQNLIKELRGQLQDVNSELSAARRAQVQKPNSNTKGRTEEDLSKALKAAEKETKELKDLVRRTERELAAEIDNSKSLNAKLQSSNNSLINPSTVVAIKGSESQDMSEKLHLYEDFTGMLITKTHIDMDKIRYNCVQSGRNGSLQYQITIPLATPDEIMYKPLLEPERDARLLALLSEGHREEITFSRSEQGCNFFICLINALDSVSESDEEDV